MAKKKSPTPAFEVDYEGMGTCIEAYIKIDGQNICTLGSNSPEANNKVREIISLIKDWAEARANVIKK